MGYVETGSGVTNNHTEVDYFPVIAYHIMFYCSYTTSVCQHLQ